MTPSLIESRVFDRLTPFVCGIALRQRHFSVLTGICRTRVLLSPNGLFILIYRIFLVFKFKMNMSISDLPIWPSNIGALMSENRRYPRGDFFEHIKQCVRVAVALFVKFCV